MTNLTANNKNSNDNTQQLKSVINALPGNIYWKDTDGVFLGCNNHVAKTIGLDDPEEIEGKTNKDIFDDDKALSALDKNDKDVLSSGKTIIKEEKSASVASDSFDVWYSAKAPMLDKEGGIVGLVGLALPIRELKIKETELQVALEEAKISDQIKETFINNLSHDIRTPITGALGLLSEIEALTKHHREVQLLCEYTRGSIESCVNLFNSILDTVDISNNNLKTQKKVFFLKEMLQDVITMYQASVVGRDIKLSIEVDKRIDFPINAHKQIIHRVIVNIIDNAIKFTNSGHVKIYAAFKDKSLMTIEVEDTGQGISVKEHERVFEKFYRCRSNKSINTIGSGMGLYMVKRYLDLIGGDIRLITNKFEGTTCVLNLPYEEMNKAPTEHENKELTVLEVKSIKPSSKKLLVVEDNNVVMYGLEKMLTRMGYDIDMAKSGKEAIELIGKHIYQATLLDIGLPDMSGTDVISAIKDKDFKENIGKVIILSGYVNDANIVSFKNQGATLVLAKPISAGNLEALLEKNNILP